MRETITAINFGDKTIIRKNVSARHLLHKSWNTFIAILLMLVLLISRKIIYTVAREIISTDLNVAYWI